MLVLSRKRNETICIGEDIKVRVVEVRGDKVRLGFEAPEELEIHREEIYELIKKETENGTGNNPEIKE